MPSEKISKRTKGEFHKKQEVFVEKLELKFFLILIHRFLNEKEKVRLC